MKYTLKFLVCVFFFFFSFLVSKNHRKTNDWNGNARHTRAHTDGIDNIEKKNTERKSNENTSRKQNKNASVYIVRITRKYAAMKIIHDWNIGLLFTVGFCVVGSVFMGLLHMDDSMPSVVFSTSSSFSLFSII